MEDRESRKDKLVWFGIKECDAENGETRKQADLEYVTQLGEKVFGFKKPGVFKNAKRLGKKGEGCRPLLTTLATADLVKEVLAKAKDLGETHSGVSVKRDMTPLEREEMRKLVKLRNLKREQTAQKKSGEFWVIRNKKVVDVARKRVEVAPKRVEGEIEIN